MNTYKLTLAQQFDHFNSRFWWEIREYETGEVLFDGPKEHCLLKLVSMVAEDKYFTEVPMPQSYVVVGVNVEGNMSIESYLDNTVNSVIERHAEAMFNDDADSGFPTVEIEAVIDSSMQIERVNRRIFKESLMFFDEVCE